MYVEKVKTEERYVWLFVYFSMHFDSNLLFEYKNILSKLFLYEK